MRIESFTHRIGRALGISEQHKPYPSYDVDLSIRLEGYDTATLVEAQRLIPIRKAEKDQFEKRQAFLKKNNPYVILQADAPLESVAPAFKSGGAFDSFTGTTPILFLDEYKLEVISQTISAGDKESLVIRYVSEYSRPRKEAYALVTGVNPDTKTILIKSLPAGLPPRYNYESDRVAFGRNKDSNGDTAKLVGEHRCITITNSDFYSFRQVADVRTGKIPLPGKVKGD